MEPEIQTLLVSIWDVRIGMPLGVFLGLKIWESYVIGLLGGLTVGIFLWGFQFLLRFFTRIAPRFTNWLFRLNKKNRRSIEKYGYWGLFLLVAVPLPGTGTWTGAFIAGILQMRIWESFIVIFLGMSISGLISMLFTSTLVN